MAKPDVVDDFDYKEKDINIACLSENVEKLKRRSQAYRPRQLYPPRPDKRLLVLDIDYTIFDHLSPAESVHQLARPYLFEFLCKAYTEYDLAIWSATSMTWILAKLSQLGVIPRNSSVILQRQASASHTQTALSVNAESSTENQAPFHVCLLLDFSDMISVYFPNHGVKEVKPLSVIWNNHPQWGPHNTVMVDDIRRNFIMNPQSGLRIRSYRDAHVNHCNDRQLKLLSCYFSLIAARETDFRQLNHNRWERYVSKHSRSRRSSKRSRNAHRGARCRVVDELVSNLAAAASPSASDVGSGHPVVIAHSGDSLAQPGLPDLQEKEEVGNAASDSCCSEVDRESSLKSDSDA